MDIHDKEFILGTVGKIFKHLNSKFTALSSSIKNLGQSFSSSLAKTLNVEVKNDINLANQKDYSGNIQQVIDSVKSLNKEPFYIESPDFSGMVTQLEKVQKAIEQINIPETSMEEVVGALDSVRKQIELIPETIIPDQEKVIFPTQISFKEAREIIDHLKNLKKSLAKPQPREKKIDLSPITKGLKSLEKAFKSLPGPKQAEFPESISIDNFPPTKTALPVTNININPLRGLVHTTSTTVKSTRGAIPGYGVSLSRRSLVFQNLSTTTDVYIGGSDVTTSNGYLLEAEATSPFFDSGPRQIWYGVTSSGTADIRCLELDNDSGG